jgi:hypothetical protein
MLAIVGPSQSLDFAETPLRGLGMPVGTVSRFGLLEAVDDREHTVQRVTVRHDRERSASTPGLA